MNNIEIFNDTQNHIRNNEHLWALTQHATHNTRVIGESFISGNCPDFDKMHVSFEENLTLIPAIRLTDEGKKTAILNFANPVEPGGGVLRGANAQEEYLCRASNLYNCLISDQAKSFYQYHRNRIGQNTSVYLGSDIIVYSPGITVIREDRGYFPDMECYPKQEYTDTWRTVDVITCAAPFFSRSDYLLGGEELYQLFCRRIKNIFETAIENRVQALILGAFGCGAFHNPPVVVAKAFSDVLMEKRYSNAFSNVVFAVRRSGSFCENIEAFDIAFREFPPSGQYVFSTETNKRRFFE